MNIAPGMCLDYKMLISDAVCNDTFKSVQNLVHRAKCSTPQCPAILVVDVRQNIGTCIQCDRESTSLNIRSNV